MVDKKPIFDLVRSLLKEHNPAWVTFSSEEIARLDAAIDKAVGVVPVKTTGKFKFNTNSSKIISGVHPHLQAVMTLALSKSDIDFTVLEGMRLLSRQRVLVAQGASKTLNSRHLTGHAIDVAPLINGKVSWDWPLYHKMAVTIKAAAKELNIPLEWGGDWKSFKDGPHWQLPFKEYPK